MNPITPKPNFLKDNAKLLQAKNCQIQVATAQHALATLKDQFDVVFLDPPYSLNLWQELANAVDPFIKNDGFIYVEADQDLNRLVLPTTWKKRKETKAGSVRAGLYQKTNLE